MKYDPGQLILVTSGEYSDYGVDALIRVVSTFDWNTELESFSSTHKGYHYLRPSAFINHLAKQGTIEEVTFEEENMR